MTTASIILTGLPRLGLSTDLLINNWGHYDRITWYIALWRRKLPHYTDYSDLTDKELFKLFSSRLPPNHNIAECGWYCEQDFDTIPKCYTEFYSRPENIWYGHKLAQRMNTIRRYRQIPTDLIIRARTDAAPHAAVSLHAVNQILEQNPMYILCPNDQRQTELDYNDQLTIGLEHTMNTVFDSVDWFDRLYTLGIPYNSEWLESVYLKNLAITWPRPDWSSTLRRTGVTTDTEYIPDLGTWL